MKKNAHLLAAPASSSLAMALALVSLVGNMGCAGPNGGTDTAPATEALWTTTTDSTGEAEFEVEVRYAGGLTRAEAQALLDGIEIVAAREVFPDFKDQPAEDSDEPLDASEPTFEVLLHPLNERAASEPFLWQSTVDSGSSVEVASNEEELGQIRQGLFGVDLEDLFETLFMGVPGFNQLVDLHIPEKVLSPGSSWSTARYRCRAFVFGADFLGAASACVDLGYQGEADQQCRSGYRPDEPIVVPHPGADLNPSNKHYFRGRVKASSLWGVGTGTVLIGAATLCLP